DILQMFFEVRADIAQFGVYLRQSHRDAHRGSFVWMKRCAALMVVELCVESKRQPPPMDN
ncbi:MAG TPA: hypothetical protein VKY59_07465, partial [Spirillospora sp.]|nr:hypothetical protein [Spirillospora sp.]